MALVYLAVYAAGFSTWAIITHRFANVPALAALIIVVTAISFSFEYWRRPPHARLSAASAIVISAAAIGAIALLAIVAKARPINGVRIVVVLGVFLGPCSLLVDGIRRAWQGRGGRKPEAMQA